VFWNSFSTAGPFSVTAELTTFTGGGGDEIGAYIARPKDIEGQIPGLVWIHHMPGFDEFTFEAAERLARHGYEVIVPDLYSRYGHGTPDDVFAKVRSEGGVHDDSVVADAAAALAYLKAQPHHNGKVGITGTCSGGRNAYLVACRTKKFDAVADLWGGGVVAPKESLTPKQPVAPVDYTRNLSAPLLGLFGNDDQRPAPADVDAHEAELKKHGKDYEFHRYDGAGHGFFYYDRPAYRQQQAMDGWNKVFAFFAKHLKGK